MSKINRGFMKKEIIATENQSANVIQDEAFWARVRADRAKFEAEEPLIADKRKRHLALEHGYLAAGIYECPPGCISYVIYALDELPNDLITIDDLKVAGIFFDSH
jgi:hypothetical protein